MKDLTTRQSCLMIFIITCATKLLVLPSLIISRSGNAVWLAILMMTAIDMIFFLLIFAITKAFPNFTMREFFEKGCGKVIAKILFFVLGLLFAMKVAMLIRECYEFYTETAYVDLNWFTFLFPVGLMLGYVATKPLNAMGRSLEIFIYFIAMAIIMAFLFSVSSVDFFAFLPFVKNGMKSVLSSCLDYAFWFGDFLLLMMIMGKIKIEKNFFGKVTLSYLSAMSIVVALAFIHYSLFGAIADTYKTTIVDVTEYTPRLSTSGRFTWVIVFLWPIAEFVAMGFYVHFATNCFTYCFSVSTPNEKFVSASVVALACSLILMAWFSQILMTSAIASVLKYFVLAIQYFVPMFLPIMLVNVKRRVLNEKSVEK